jgi:hypothetical protein
MFVMVPFGSWFDRYYKENLRSCDQGSPGSMLFELTNLRHLRVIVYDVREPQWDVKLRSAVTELHTERQEGPREVNPTPISGDIGRCRFAH